MHARDAAHLALRSLLNCVAREYDDRIVFSGMPGREEMVLTFPSAGGRLAVALAYRSQTGHHLFQDRITLRTEGSETELSPVQAIDVIIDRLDPSSASGDGRRDLAQRTESSRLFVEKALEARAGEIAALRGAAVSFVQAEQGLIAGHGVHPCPKSREGMSDAEARRYSPEFGSAFPMRWFAIARRFVHTGHSEGSPSAEDWLEIADGADLAPLRQRLPNGDFAMLPVHPWQAHHMLDDPLVAKLVAEGHLIDVGETGQPWLPTASVRTLYRPDAPFMLKVSLGIGITNSVRINLARELLRGNDMYRFRASPLWQDLVRDYPCLSLIPDPAFISVGVNGTIIDGLSVSLRENPFHGADSERNVTLLAALCEHIPGHGSRLGALIRDRAAAENRSIDAVATDWFARFLRIFVRPIFGLYLRHGIALEAHQQNMLVEIKGGYPTNVFYRDNQGFFHHERAHAALAAALPGFGEASESVFGEESVDDRVLYYGFINSVLGMIGALGREALAEETALLNLLREELRWLEAREGGRSGLVRTMLGRTLRCKANLRTRLARMDELVGPLETQSVYLEIANPLAMTERQTQKAVVNA